MTFHARGKEFKRQMIEEGAYQLFSSRTYESVTVEDLARHLGCGKGTIYRYFENKDHLLSKLVASGLSQLCDDMKTDCVNNPDVMEAMKRYLSLQYHFFLAYNTILSSWSRRRLEMAIKPEWYDEIQTLLNLKVKMLAGILDRGIEEGIIMKVNSGQLASLLESLVRDATFFPFSESRPRNQDEDGMLDLMTAIFIKGIMSEGVKMENPG